MNKKLVLMGASIVVGTTMLITTAFASMTGNTGYEIYKEAVKNTAHSKSFTADMNMSIKDNGKTLADAATIMKRNHDARAMSNTTTMKAQGKEISMETYASEENVVLKKSDTEEYYLIKGDRKDFGRHGRDFRPDREPEMSKAGETVIDALVGDLKNYVSASENADGSSNVTIKLEDNQIPAVVNALASFGIKSAANEDRHIRHSHKPAVFEENFDIEHPELVEDIKINKVNVNAKISKDRIIESQTMTVVLTGKDAGGDSHEVEFTMDMELKDLNSTTVDTIDLTGKKVKEIKPEDMSRESER